MTFVAPKIPNPWSIILEGFLMPTDSRKPRSSLVSHYGPTWTRAETKVPGPWRRILADIWDEALGRSPYIAHHFSKLSTSAWSAIELCVQIESWNLRC